MQSLPKVFLLNNLEIYQMNMNQSNIPYDDSIIGPSIVEGSDSIIGNNTGPKEANHVRVSKQIPEVIIEE